MHLLDHFASFMDKTVNLNQSRLDRLERHLTAVTNYLTGDDGIADDVIPQGSHAHRTIIKPLDGRDFDVDALVRMEHDDEMEPSDYIDVLYDTLRESATYADKITKNTRCVTIQYANDFHIDLVPYLVINGEHWITNRKNNAFEPTNPEGFTAWLGDADLKARDHLVPVIRLMKYLRDHKGTFTAPSIILTTLLGDAVEDDDFLTGVYYYEDLPTSLTHIVEDLDAYLQQHETMPDIEDPSCPGTTFNHRWDQDKYANFRNCIHRYAEWMREALEEEDEEKSLVAWQRVFGPSFVAPSSDERSELANRQASASRVAPTEMFIDKDLGFAIAKKQHRFEISGTVAKKNGYRCGPLKSRGNRVDKDRTIWFGITKCDVPEPFDVYWKVRNYGEEAAGLDALRGEITKGERRLRETTSYHGSHYVEAYAVKDGQVVATARQPVHVM